jgi:hypothetical protein
MSTEISNKIENQDSRYEDNFQVKNYNNLENTSFLNSKKRLNR